MRSSGRDSGRGNHRGAGNQRDDKQKRAGRPRPEERRYDVPGAHGGSEDKRSGGRPGGGSGRPGGGSGRPGGSGKSGGGPDSASRGSGSRANGSGSGSRGSGSYGSGSGSRGNGSGSGSRGSGSYGSGSGSYGSGSDSYGSGSGSRSGARGDSARGGAKGGPRRGTKDGAGPRGPRTAAARPRELDAKLEERNRERYAERDSRPKPPKTFPGAEQEGERLQKVLARAGYGSRRACEELIEQARVEVNGEIVLEQGLRVKPSDEIKVDGLTVATQSYQFFSLNKPAGVVATMEDPEGRQNLGDYVNNRETRLFHVGRLDTETEGVILLTNHGELAHRLTHPRYGVRKTYLAHIVGPIPRDLGKRLKDGIELEDGWARADHFRVVEQTGKNYLVEVTLHEGRKHIVRRMLAEAGFPVDKLVRTAFGPITLGDQKSGWLRRLSNTEVGMLMREVDL
ncbi:pseudouridine synthase [Streptomyces evansiae]|uniref:pseudouridine synthase n=1 Tax=Streptomyces evansiae TaxID=3075535 RepID=UPI0028849E87|nr:pseudouridine synthase [Streptomyces sp. DSM 41859]MDT0423320.1 pseudouridine synthase [Streptomyces sp. DSM 41859]